ALDPVGGETGSQVFESLGDGGRMLVYGTLSGEPLRIAPRVLISGKRVLEGFWLGHWMREQSIPAVLMHFREMGGRSRAGVLATEIGPNFPIEQVIEAAHAAESVGHRGKVLLRPPG